MNNDFFGLSITEFEESINKIDDLIKSIENGEADNFIKEKGQNVLQRIMQEQNIDSDQRAGDYISGNDVEITKKYIKFFNNSEIDIETAETWLNDYGKTFYPSTLSLSELIEYGAGLVGAQNSKGIDGEWQYMMNPNRDYQEGWEWNNNGKVEHTQGQAGRYIYYSLSEEIKENGDEWLKEFFEKKVGDS